MSKKSMSNLDAFLALEELDDEEIKLPLKEGKGFNVRNEAEMDKAEEFVNTDKKKEVALEVIDVDADSLDHLKNNEEYVGQMILQCNSCKANKFINAEDLVQSEGDDDVYNIEDECPHCHGKGNGFHLIGQVGKVPEEEPEATFDNDSLTNEPKFDNEPEEAPAEEQPAEEQPAEEPEEIEDNGMETSAEDDTADMESTLGDEFNSDDVEYDDTEEKPEEPKEEDSLTNKEDEYNEPLSYVEEPEEEKEDKKKEESLDEDIDVSAEAIYDLFDLIVEPENIENVLVFDLDSANEDEEVYNGSAADIPSTLLESEVVGFDVGQGTLIVNIDSESEIDEATMTVRTALEKFTDDFNENISVWDQATGEEVFSGTKQSVVEEFGHNAFLSFEAPERLEIKVRSVDINEALKTPYTEVLDLANPEDRLISNVLKENNIADYKVNNFGSEAYWIAESIRQKEDLKHIYENYIKSKSNSLINEFKDVTGYKDNLDVLYEETLNESSEDNEEETLKKAKEKFNNPEVTAVIYGYESRGKFHTLQNGEIYEITNDRELQMATELVKAKYHPTGSVKVFYRDGLEPETKESLEADFRNRKDLSEAVLDCEAKGIEYKIKRSLKEGYRYTLIKEKYSLKEEYALTDSGFKVGDLVSYHTKSTNGKGNLETHHGMVLDCWDKDNPNHIIGIFQLDSWGTIDVQAKDIFPKPITVNDLTDKEKENYNKAKKFADDRIKELSNVKEAVNEDNQLGFFEETDARDDELANKIFEVVHRIAEAIKEVYPEAEVNESALLVDFMSDLHLQSSNPDFFDLAQEPLQLVQERIKDEFQGFHKALENLDGFNEEEANQVKNAIADLDSEEFSYETLKEKAQSEDFVNSLEDGEIFGVVLHSEEEDEDEDENDDFEDTDESLNEANSDKYILSYTDEDTTYYFTDNRSDNYVTTNKEDAYKASKKEIEDQKEWFADSLGIDSTEDLKLEQINESVDIHIEDNDVTIKDNSGEDVAIISINPEDEENESLNEDVKSIEEKAHDEVVKKVFEPRGITELDWSVEEQEDDEGREWLNIVHFLTKEDWEKLYKEGDSIKEGLTPSFGSFTTEYSPFFELDRGIRIFDRDAICFYSEAPDFDESLNESEDEKEYKALVSVFSDGEWIQSFNLRTEAIPNNRWGIWVTGKKEDLIRFAQEHNKDLTYVYVDGIPEYYELEEKEGWEEAAKWLKKQEEKYPDIAVDILTPEDIIPVEEEVIPESLNEAKKKLYTGIGSNGLQYDPEKQLFFCCLEGDVIVKGKTLEELENKIGDVITLPYFDVPENINVEVRIDKEDEGFTKLEEFKQKFPEWNEEAENAWYDEFNFDDFEDETFGSVNVDVYLNESLKESLDEAKKDDELPADPEVVKTNVHATLNNLVTDEIEAINGYEEAKAEIADTHIEHKDDIIDTIDHIEDEEQEHIDELIDAASEIPFEKEGHEEVKEEPIEEPEIEEEPEISDDEIEFDEAKFESFINEWFNNNVEDTQLFEATSGTINENGTIVIEGKLIKEDVEQGVSFTLTPNKEMNEDLMDSKKVTTYIITSTSLPEGLVCKLDEGFYPMDFKFKNLEDAKNFIKELFPHLDQDGLEEICSKQIKDEGDRVTWYAMIWSGHFGDKFKELQDKYCIKEDK